MTENTTTEATVETTPAPVQQQQQQQLTEQELRAKLKNKALFVATPMYGGNCNGVFARSIADLSAICRALDIPLQLYFLFNESLITRARNYCCDEFMRSPATHLMFIDSDIGFDARDVVNLMLLATDESEYDIIGGAYPKKSLDYKSKITTEDGQKSLGWVVKHKYKGKVLSFNEENGFEYKSILAHHKTDKNGKRWVTLRTSRDSQGKIECTHDHEIAIVEDLFKPQIKYLSADQTLNKHIVRVPVANKKLLTEPPLFSQEQLSFLYGTILGDSSIRKNGQLTCSHSTKAEAYAVLKAKLFGLNHSYEDVKIGEKIHNAINIFGATNAQTKQLRADLYINGKKSLKNIIEKLDLKSLAMMYMDDGYMCVNSLCSFFCTENFTVEENELFANKLTELGFESSVQRTGKQDTVRVRIKKAATRLFNSAIAPYIIPSMEYKLLPQYRGGNKFNYDLVAKLKYSAQRITDVVMLNSDKDQYDITVEDNFNFVTQGSLVHNCISWEKIRVAVDKGFADKNPNDLEKFVGDYVFNLKGNSQSIPINQPAEVLELGTGFMMIRRRTLEKFAEKFAHLSYRPDHVRTEHFDGSREIMLFFQAETDNTDFRAIYLNMASKLKQTTDPEGIAAIIKEAEDTMAVKKSKRYLSEDYWFCQKIQEIGLKTWLCPWMKLQHVGSFVFGGSLADIAAVGVSATADAGILEKGKNRTQAQQPVQQPKKKRN